jgi:hypothetical protein
LQVSKGHTITFFWALGERGTTDSTDGTDQGNNDEDEKDDGKERKVLEKITSCGRGSRTALTSGAEKTE